jgi:RNA polymerase sigma-70 factor (ECF subfamily)
VRARQRRAEVSDELVADAEAPPPGDGISGDLMAALRALDPEQRALVVLRHVLGYRSSELAGMLGLPAATVRTRLARALAELRTLLDGEDA